MDAWFCFVFRYKVILLQSFISCIPVTDPVYMSRKIRKFRTDKFRYVKQTEILTHATHVNGWFPAVYPCNSCKWLVPSRLHELHESKFPFVSRIEFIRSKLSNFSAHVYGVTVYN